MSDVSGMYKIAVIRSREDNRMVLCEVPRSGYIDAGDVVLYHAGTCDSREGVCMYPSTWIDDTSLALIEAVTEISRPFPTVYGRMVMERFTTPSKGE